MNPEVDFYFTKAKKWQEEIEQLRTIVLDCGLTEDLKWGSPCYTANGSNIVLIHVFKEYCALLFFKGVLLKDPKHILVQQTKNVQSSRQIRFTDISEINQLEKSIRIFIQQAIDVEKAGLKVPMKETKEFTVPEEFQTTLDEDAFLKKAFKELTPGRQRAYLLYFSGAKQAQTRVSRIEKSRENILKGKGLND